MIKIGAMILLILSVIIILVSKTYQYYAHQKIEARVAIDFQDSDAQDIIVDKGGDRVLLMLHGFSTGPQEFKPLLPYLEQKNMSYVILNLEGHNEKNAKKLGEVSYKTWESQVLEMYEMLAKQYKYIDVIGYSNGANLALKLSHQKHIRNLVLINPFSYPSSELSFLYKISQTKLAYVILDFLIGYIPMDPEYKRPVYQYPYVPFSSLIEILELQSTVDFSQIDAEQLFMIYAKNDTLSDYALLIEEKLSPQLEPENILVLEDSTHRALEESERDKIEAFLDAIAN